MHSPYSWKWTVLIVLIVLAGIAAALLGGWTWDDSLMR